jgi:hypothetical protein
MQRARGMFLNDEFPAARRACRVAVKAKRLGRAVGAAFFAILIEGHSDA